MNLEETPTVPASEIVPPEWPRPPAPPEPALFSGELLPDPPVEWLLQNLPPQPPAEVP